MKLQLYRFFDKKALKLYINKIAIVEINTLSNYDEWNIQKFLIIIDTQEQYYRLKKHIKNQCFQKDKNLLFKEKCAYNFLHRTDLNLHNINLLQFHQFLKKRKLF